MERYSYSLCPDWSIAMIEKYCGREGYHNPHEWVADASSVYPYAMCPGKSPFIVKIINGAFWVVGVALGLLMFLAVIIFWVTVGGLFFGGIWR